MENLRPGALERLGLGLGLGIGRAGLRATRPGLVTCSISAWGSTGPSRDEPGWEPLVHARAGAQQGLFTGDDPIWLPFPTGERGRRAARGARRRRGAGRNETTTGYGQHVETSLFDGLLFLNAAPIFHREGHRPGVVPPDEDAGAARVRHGRRPLRHGEPERHGALARAVPPARHRTTVGSTSRPRRRLAKLSDQEWNRVRAASASSTDSPAGQPTSGRQALLAATGSRREVQHARGVARARTGPHRRAGGRRRGPVPLVGSLRCASRTVPGERRSGRRHGSEHGALGGHRVVDLSSFWAGPLAARLLAELGADVVKVEPPGGEGGFQLMPVLPNIYVDGNRSKRGLVLDLQAAEDRARLLDLVAAVGCRGRERDGRDLGAPRARTKRSCGR